MEPGSEKHRDHAAALEAELATARAERAAALAELAVAKAKEADDQAIILRQKVYIEKLQRELRGQKSERTARLIAQMELMLEDAEATATEDELAAEMAVAAAAAIAVTGFTRKRPVKKPFPEHLPRERVVVPGPVACSCCGGERLRKLGEDITETMESVPRSWKVIQTVREKFTCRDCEKISQAPAPFHVIPRGWAGPSLLAMMLCDKFGQHIPLNRQVERFALEGVPISLSTAADAIGACCQVLDPLVKRIESHTFASERIHGDDTTVPVLALGKTATVGYGVTSRTMLRLEERHHRRRCSIIPATVPVNIHRRIWPIIAASFRRMPIRAMASSIFPIEVRARFMRRVLGACQATILCASRSGDQCAPKGAGQKCRRYLTSCPEYGAADRRAVRDRTQGQWPLCR